jgi:hypothetical protein
MLTVLTDMALTVVTFFEQKQTALHDTKDQKKTFADWCERCSWCWNSSLKARSLGA